MTIEYVKKLAETFKIDFLVISETPHNILCLYAPYMPKNFINYMETQRSYSIHIRYKYSKGFFHWLAWKLRTRKLN